MATIAQATYMGGDVIIECDSRWDCCQREQAATKVRQMNANLPGDGIRAAVTPAMEGLKAACQRNATQLMDAQTSQEQAESAEAAGAAPCLVQLLRDGGTRKNMGLQMDHPLDTKWGGAADGVTLTPLDAVVNHALGLFSKNVGNRMADAGHTEVKEFHLICPPSYPGCPTENHSQGPKGAEPFPSNWYRTSVASGRVGGFIM
jgi:hypothetical protein